GDVAKLLVELLGALSGRGLADPDNIHERAATIAHRLEDLARAAAPVVFDDHAGAGSQIRLHPRVGAARVADGHRDLGFVKTAGERPILDDELDLESGEQNLVEHPDDEFVLANSKTPHQRTNLALYALAELAAAAGRLLLRLHRQSGKICCCLGASTGAHRA